MGEKGKGPAEPPPEGAEGELLASSSGSTLPPPGSGIGTGGGNATTEQGEKGNGSNSAEAR